MIFILSPLSCPMDGTLGRWGCPGESKNIFLKNGLMAYQIDRDDEQNKLQVKFSSSPRVKRVTLEGYRLTFFHQEQAGPLNQNDWGPSPKLRGPGFSGKLT